jgi:uncharacterized protein YifE (UPF0438 family)
MVCWVPSIFKGQLSIEEILVKRFVLFCLNDRREENETEQAEYKYSRDVSQMAYQSNPDLYHVF